MDCSWSWRSISGVFCGSGMNVFWFNRSKRIVNFSGPTVNWYFGFQCVSIEMFGCWDKDWLNWLGIGEVCRLLSLRMWLIKVWKSWLEPSVFGGVYWKWLFFDWVVERTVGWVVFQPFLEFILDFVDLLFEDRILDRKQHEQNMIDCSKK